MFSSFLGKSPSPNTFGAGQLMNIFRGMTGHYELKSGSTKQYDLTNYYKMNMSSSVDPKEQIIGQINTTFDDRANLLRELRNVRYNEIVQTILSFLVKDGFSSISDDSFLVVNYKPTEERNSKIDDEIREEIDNFITKQDIVGLCRDIIEDWMYYGEYFLRTRVVSGKGIVEIIDDCSLDEYMAFYKGRELDSFWRYNQKREKYESYDKYDLTHFCLDNSRLRLSVETKESIQEIPEYIRMGKSVIFPVLTSLKKLNALEVTSLATELKRVMAPILVSVNVNPDQDSQYLTEIIDKYENILNDMNANARNIDNLSLEDVLQLATPFKVIPKFADEKGAIEQIKFEYDNSDLNNRINDVRKNIAMAVGVPSFYLSYGDQMLGKNEMLKVYSSYAKKLVSLQTSFGNGIKSILYKHLYHKEYYVNMNDIDVKFKSIVNVDFFDDLEIMLGAVGALKDLFAVIEQISASDQFGIVADDEKIIDFYNTFMASFPNLQGIFKLYANGNKKPKVSEVPLEPSGDMGRGGNTPKEFQAVNLTATGGGAPSPASTPSPASSPPQETPSGSQVSVTDVF
jgi:hypothetical protein